ncbi:MotB [Oceanicola granulosus HTCC2516]|uniref:MotB n=1 Tax=Oceanicola granulosus (strain ATCC BAA-861 / DSM 15982 / KCTC 12143 / HTCC2516) TaxID=314256 RepID=Q2CGF4_OCEGH|nr:flagellar motor protein MotB [Oceanicola granulosus]EAR51764.1 MotB [Oceanicola granulosus HTCC2516]
MSSEKQPIIIRRMTEDAHDGHHGGGWKVAYADFMTAMMAFFLLMWIIAASDEEKLRGIADYFTPSLVTADGAGSGLLDGEAVEGQGTRGGGVVPELPSFGQENPLEISANRTPEAPSVIVEYVPVEDLGDDPFARLHAAAGEVVDGETTPLDGAGSAPEASEGEAGTAASEAALAAAELAEQRAAALEVLRGEVEERIAEDPELATFAENLLVDATDLGLRFQIVDHEGVAMFRSGSAEIEESTRELIGVVGETIRGLPYPVAITGHTDSVPFSGARDGYSNWELSADRANAARRTLIAAGVDAARIVEISGLAATELRVPDIPDAPENRRIEVLMQYPAAPAGE